MSITTTIVVDTSVLIDSLPAVKDIYANARANNTEILIPREVFRELDWNKDKHTAIELPARYAIEWIRKTLIEDYEVPCLRGQRINECSQPNLRADASILDCAVYNYNHTKRLTILFSNDKNLSNLALVEGLDTLDSWNFDTHGVYAFIKQKSMNVMELDISEPLNAQTRVKNQEKSRSKKNKKKGKPQVLPQSQPVQSVQPQPQPEPQPQSQPSEYEYEHEVDMMDQEITASSIDIAQPGTLQDNVPAASNQPQTNPTIPPISSQTEKQQIPLPIQGKDFQSEIMASVFQLVDFYISSENDELELAFNKYAKPQTSKELIAVYDSYSTTLKYLIPKRLMEQLKQATEQANLPGGKKRLARAYVQILLNLTKKTSESGIYKEYLKIRKLDTILSIDLDA